CQKGVTDRFDNRAMMRDHGLLDNLVVDVEQVQHTGFISAHLPAEAYDVGEHDRGELANLSRPRVTSILGHGRDYRTHGLRLSKSTDALLFLASVTPKG